MDWLAIIREMGGGLSAVVIFGLGHACWRLGAKVSDLHERRVQDMRESLTDTARREAETITALNTINASLQTVVALVQHRSGGQ